MSNQSSTLDTVSNILKDYYLGPSRPIYRLEREWTCPTHDRPHYAKYEEVCDFDPKCHDYECPHTYEQMTDPGCPACQDAEWKIVLDKNGEPIVHYEQRTALIDQLNMQSVLLSSMMKESIYEGGNRRKRN